MEEASQINWKERYFELLKDSKLSRLKSNPYENSSLPIPTIAPNLLLKIPTVKKETPLLQDANKAANQDTPAIVERLCHLTK